MTYDEAMKNVIFRYLAGSHAYGTNVEGSSDEDYRGVFVAPLSAAFSLFQTSFMGQGTIHQHLVNALTNIELGEYVAAQERIRQALEVGQGDLNFSVGTVSKPGNDEELQELRKFLKLAAECNPNIVEYLYVDRGITHETKEWRMIRAERGNFLSRKAKGTFAGYAATQLKRIENHRRYLLNPPGEKPERADFGLPPETLVPKENQNALLSLGAEWVNEDKRDYAVREKRYQGALDEWRSYKKWEKERNPKRRDMEAVCGFDAKHASHLVRLLRMAEEILLKGEVIVFRPDHEELLAIRQGKWAYERLMEHVAEMEARIEIAAAASTLREKPDYKAIDALYKRIVREKYGITV
jgi:predicted nucleotidyltransferase